MSDFSASLDNKDKEKRIHFRAMVKECSVDDLVNVSRKYLFNKSAKSLIAGENYINEIESLDFTVKNIWTKKIKIFFSLALLRIPNIVVDTL